MKIEDKEKIDKFRKENPRATEEEVIEYTRPLVFEEQLWKIAAFMANTKNKAKAARRKKKGK